MPDHPKVIHLIGTLGQFDASYKLRELAGSQAASGAEVNIVAFSATKQSREFAQCAGGVRCQHVHKRWNYDPFARRQLIQLLRELKSHYVFLWGRRATDAAITVRRALPEAHLVATLVKVPQLANPWWPNRSLHALDAIVVEREATRLEFIDAGLGEEKVHVIATGVKRPSAAPRSRGDVLAQLGLDSEARIVAIAGPLERWQLADEAIWCFELIRILHEHAALVIVGEGPERSRLERFTRQVTDPRAVRFVTQSAMLHDVLAHAEIYWQPGICRSIPTTLLSAMLQGLPVVASDIPTHREIIQTEKNGILTPPGKRAVWARHTDQLWRSEELRSKLGQAARKSIEEKYSLAAMIEGYNEYLLAAGGRKGLEDEVPSSAVSAWKRGNIA